MTDALCFDMYGTLCDTSSVTETLGEELGVPAQFASEIDELWRSKQLQYSYQLGQMGTYQTFWEATENALEYTLDYYGLDVDEATRSRVLDAYNYLDPFPDTLDALATLQDEGYQLAVLSNGNPEMLETLAVNTGIDEFVDDIISAHEVETFKPAPTVYENAADRLGRTLTDCRLVSSNAWDIAGASQAGMATGWVNRKREPMERVGGNPDLVAASLTALARKL